MKKVYFIFLWLLMTLNIFAQSRQEVNRNNENEEGSYSIMQATVLFGNYDASNRVYHYFPYDKKSLSVSSSISFSHGHVFDENWSTGLGVGFDIFDHNLFPLFAEIRYTLSKYKISPFAVVKGGYSFGWIKARHYDELYLNWTPYQIYDADLRHYGGLMAHPEIGVIVPLTENSGLLISAGYHFQKTKSIARKNYENDEFEEWERKKNFNRLSFGVGIIFK